MKNILVIGSTGQIGSELTKKLREIYGGNHVVAGYIKGAEPKGELAESGPKAECDVTNPQMIADVVKQYNIDTIYNLAALLSSLPSPSVRSVLTLRSGRLLRTPSSVRVQYTASLR